jgi:hypothetical protein
MCFHHCALCLCSAFTAGLCVPPVFATVLFTACFHAVLLLALFFETSADFQQTTRRYNNNVVYMYA